MSEALPSSEKAIDPFIDEKGRSRPVDETMQILTAQRHRVADTLSGRKGWEALERAENPKMLAAVKAAVGMGIVREEILLAPGATRTATLLPSTHYDPVELKNTPPDVVRSQVELFQLLCLLQNEQVPGRLLVEGALYTGAAYAYKQQLTGVPEMREKQQYFFQHPNELDRILKEQLQDASQFPPLCFTLSTFPFDGAEPHETHERSIALIEKLRNCCDFRPVVQNIIKAMTSLGLSPTNSLNIQPYFLDGKWHIVIVGQNEKGCIIPAAVFEKEAGGYLANLQELAFVDTLREQSMAQLLVQTPEASVPIAWMGLGHALPVAKLLQETMHVRILTPRTSTHVDIQKLLGQHSLENKLLVELLKHARHILTLPKPC